MAGTLESIHLSGAGMGCVEPRHAGHPHKSALLQKTLLSLGMALLLAAGAVHAQQGTGPAPSAPATAQNGTAAQGVGTITHLSGTLAVRRTDGNTRFLSVSSNVSEGDTLSTQQGTYARIKFADGGEVVMRPDTQFKIENYRFEEQKPEQDNMLVSLLKGGLRSVTGLLGKRNKEKVSFSTPTATVGIRGTNFGLLFCQNDCAGIGNGTSPANGLHVDVAQGAIVLSNAGGQLVLATGQFGYVPNGNTPPVTVPPSQGIQVTMPQSISKNTGGGSTLGGGRSDSECVL